MKILNNHQQRFRFSFLLSVFALILYANATYGAELTTRVDRTTISENETLQLTIRLNEQVGFSSPDFTALQQDFEILSQQRSNQIHSINGRTESWTDWNLVLAPKATGTLSIPAFNFQGATSDPVTITVTQANTTATGALPDIFVEVKTSKPTVFVQEQLLVTFKIHTGVLLRDASMNGDLTVENAVVESVSETAYNKQLNGRPYRVMELVYAVYPQKSEAITIPSMSWDLVMATDYGNGLRYRYQTPGEMRRIRSESVTIPVEPKPAHYTGESWLPASNVTLEQHWSSDPSRFTVGEPLTRTITLTADGLTAAQLPPLPAQDVDGLKIYTDQPQFDDIRTSEGIAGNRIESIAIVPTQPGKLTLPAMEVSWWDTQTQEQRIATLPPQELTIAPAAANASVPVRNLPSPEPAAETPPPTSGDTSEATLDLHWLSNILFAGLALFFMLAWVRERMRGKNRQPTPLANRQTDALNNLNAAFHAVRRACSENDPVAVRNRLGEWGRLYWQLPRTASLQDIVQRADCDAVTKELAELDKILYGCHESTTDWRGDAWRGDVLWRALVTFKRSDTQRNDKNKRHEQQTTSRLPPLYPTTH